MGARQALGTLCPEKNNALTLGTGGLDCGWSCTTCLSLVWQCQGVKLPFCCALHSSCSTF